MALLRFLRIPIQEKLLFFQAMAYALFYRIVIFLFPFKKWVLLLGKQHQASNEITANDLVQKIEKIKISAKRCMIYLPFKEKCLVEAMVAKKMLHNKGIQSTIYLGVSNSDKKELIAHAWLKCGSKVITGYKGHEKYSVLEWFS